MAPAADVDDHGKHHGRSSRQPVGKQGGGEQSYRCTDVKQRTFAVIKKNKANREKRKNTHQLTFEIILSSTSILYTAASSSRQSLHIHTPDRDHPDSIILRYTENKNNKHTRSPRDP